MFLIQPAFAESFKHLFIIYCVPGTGIHPKAQVCPGGTHHLGGDGEGKAYLSPAPGPASLRQGKLPAAQQKGGGFGARETRIPNPAL